MKNINWQSIMLILGGFLFYLVYYTLFRINKIAVINTPIGLIGAFLSLIPINIGLLLYSTQIKHEKPSLSKLAKGFAYFLDIVFLILCLVVFIL